LYAGNLELPPRAPGVPLHEIAQAEFARTHKLDPGTFEFAWWDLPAPARAAKATHALGIGVAHSCCDELMSAMTAAGLCTLALDGEACALARACAELVQRPAGGSPAELAVVLDRGWESTPSVLLYQASVV